MISGLPLIFTMSSMKDRALLAGPFAFLDTELTGGLSILEAIVLAVLMGLTGALAWYLPRMLTNWYKEAHLKGVVKGYRKDARRRKKTKAEAEEGVRRLRELESANAEARLKPLRRVIRSVLILVLGFYTLWTLDGFLDQSFLGGERESLVLFFLVEILTVSLLLQYGVGTVADMVSSLAMGTDTRVRDRRRVAKNFKSSLSTFLVLVLILLTLSFLSRMFGNVRASDFIPGSHVDSGTVLSQYLDPVVIFLSIIALTILMVAIFILLLKGSVTHPNQMDTHISRPVERILSYILIIIGFIIAVASMGGLELPEYGIALIITVVGFVLGFGLQSQIANIIAGFSIAIDRPYTIGDRIRVGREAMGLETWGDVEDISLQTTRIITTDNELVTIPNYLMATSPVWNFTRGDKKQAIDLVIGISYGSDWRLAEKIIMERVHSHPRVLKTPRPFVRIEDFAESSIKLHIWAWVADGRDILQTRSDLLGSIKDGFDDGGVEIPFPYRTFVDKKDIPKEARLSPEERRKHVQVRRYTQADYEVHSLEEEERLAGDHIGGRAPGDIKHILVPTSGTTTAGMLAEYSASLAHKMNASIVALYVLERRSKARKEDGARALQIFTKVGRAHGVSSSVRLREGPLLETILDTVEEMDIDLVIMGSGQKGLLHRWGKEDLPTEILNRSNVPVVVMPYRPELMNVDGLTKGE